MSLLSVAKAVIQSLVVAAFMAILLLPATQMLTGWLPSFPLSENRTLAPWPRVSLLRSPAKNPPRTWRRVAVSAVARAAECQR